MSIVKLYALLRACRTVPMCALLPVLLLAGCSDGSGSGTSESPQVQPELVDRAYYILPPGNYGGDPINENSLDQLPLYDGLTPLRDKVTDVDIERLFLPAILQPLGETRAEATGRPGTTILYDAYGIAHVTGATREDMAFGAGWVTARDRGVQIINGRATGRAAIADVPGISAFQLATSGQAFVPSTATEQLVTDQVQLIIDTHGDEGRQIIADMQAYCDGINAYWEMAGIDEPPYTLNDVVAMTAFIGSIFGTGGGSEAANAEYLSELRDGLGDGPGQQAWEDSMLMDDPEAPTTIHERFDYGVLTGGTVTGAVVIDKDSIVDLDPRHPTAAADMASSANGVFVPAAGPVPRREASNWLIAGAPRTLNGTNLAVMGPQVEYYYPELVMQVHLSAPGIEAQGAAVPGLAMYLLIGRTRDYAWSLTTTTHDQRDVFAEILCNPDGSAATRESTHYVYLDECRAFEQFDAGTLQGEALRYPVSVHGPVIGTATSNGRPIALSRKRSTFGRDSLNLAALKDMTEGDATGPRKLWEIADKFDFGFNWGYLSRNSIAYFSSGLLPVRAPGLDRRLPTLGTGDYEWQGFLSMEQHPHAATGPNGHLLNWNNKSAPGFMHGDDNPLGSVHRVEFFDQFPDRVDLAGVVGVMNEAATKDLRVLVWPVVSEVLHGGDAPSPLAAEVVALLDDWVAADAPRLDADDNGFFDSAGPTIMDALWVPVAEAVLSPVFADKMGELGKIRFLAFRDGPSMVDKDLRTLLGREVQGPFNLQYCGRGSLEQCRNSLWVAVNEVSAELAARYGDDPGSWLKQGERTNFKSELITETIRRTNRPTYQQLLEFAPVGTELL